MDDVRIKNEDSFSSLKLLNFLQRNKIKVSVRTNFNYFFKGVIKSVEPDSIVLIDVYGSEVFLKRENISLIQKLGVCPR